MSGRTVANLKAFWLTLFMILAFAPGALAGGFYISVEIPPTANPQLKDAVLLVRPYGCKKPSDATLSATAEGVVKGERRTVPLRLTSVSEGVYAIRQEWPAEGAWVLAINGTYSGHDTGVLVRLGANGRVEPKSQSSKHEVNAQIVPHKLTREEIDKALAGGKTTDTARAIASSVGTTKMGIGVGSGFGLSTVALLIWQGRRHKVG